MSLHYPSSPAKEPVSTLNGKKEGMRASVVDLDHCGRGEVARLIMCAAGLRFEDNRISLAEWNFVRHCEAQ